MILTYNFDNEYLGKDEERDEVYLNSIDYDYEVDISLDDVLEFFEKQNDKLDSATIEWLYDNDFFDSIYTDYGFIDFMADKYHNEAYQKYKEENEK